MKKLAIHVLTALSAAAFVALSAECALRGFDFPSSEFLPWIESAETGFAYAPLLVTRQQRNGEFDIRFETNELGMRDDPVPTRDRPSVLLLGDSFASGYGVERGRLFADLLERELRADVLNAAVGGFEIIHQARYLESRGKSMQPDLVLYALYLGNDISRNDNWIETNDGHLVALEHMPPVRTARSLKLLELWDTVAYGRRLYRDDRRAEWEPFPDYLEMCERHPSPRTSVRWDSVERLLTRIRDDATAAGAKLLVAPFSYRTANDPAARAGFLLRHPDFSVDHDFALPRQRILEMLDRLTIDAVDIDAAIGRHYARGGDPLYYTRDGHWNALGHRVAATALLPVVREALGFRPRRPHQDA